MNPHKSAWICPYCKMLNRFMGKFGACSCCEEYHASGWKEFPPEINMPDGAIALAYTIDERVSLHWYRAMGDDPSLSTELFGIMSWADAASLFPPPSPIYSLPAPVSPTLFAHKEMYELPTLERTKHYWFFDASLWKKGEVAFVFGLTYKCPQEKHTRS